MKKSSFSKLNFFSLFQEALSGKAAVLISFHDFAVEIQILILVVVLASFFSVMFTKSLWMVNFSMKKLEFFWTVIPSFILLILVVPSIWSLYFVDDEPETDSFTISAVGSQWYWNFANSNGLLNESHSNMADQSHLSLEVDLPCLLTEQFWINWEGSSTDVIHSLALPSLGVKMDCIPGKMNHFSTEIVDGVFFGQCSELCGVNHANMPIVVCVFNSIN